MSAISADIRIELFISIVAREYFIDFPKEREVFVPPQTTVAQIVGKTPEKQANEFVILLNGKNVSFDEIVKNGDRLSIIIPLIGG